MATNTHNPEDLQRINYELFIWMCTTLALFNTFLIFLSKDFAAVSVAIRINLLLCLVFLLDFFHRLRTADSKHQYFFKHYGWLDLLSSLPINGSNLARVVRLIRTTRSLRALGGRAVIRDVGSHRANTALFSIFLGVILILEFGSIAILKAEAGADGATIQNAEDAFWWVIVTIATVGYGDEYPVTEAGRFVGIVIIVAGVATFSTLSGYLAHNFLGRKQVPEGGGIEAIDEVLVELKQLREENAELRQMQEQTHADIRVLKSSLADQHSQTNSESKKQGG